jgi:hypothetical protein
MGKMPYVDSIVVRYCLVRSKITYVLFFNDILCMYYRAMEFIPKIVWMPLILEIAWFKISMML